ncbi:uncharacterized protein L969DRAFT_92638 [Mixia osmundae IAM 14324]|uniref:Integrase zinc-binding domain-containing protein n=1 Tax=Mixia osmundae (strain CBS 9802 / IAM 14324 / JCM 22182 / KY 12970) TaxID=764103 RepID=G7DY46_MIXOS|nr:uncharacterized protein L969DRAFT_92638 [Mixia osmundae IAM 14324]KEI41408.1 hypothetical protein L969DRAFT_92638 [Mixia osmundae IAM 14324]GAA95506.1 hypothetical protein E5Q_02161 [Mixia osmundae IAM 14324]
MSNLHETVDGTPAQPPSYQSPTPTRSAEVDLGDRADISRAMRSGTVDPAQTLNSPIQSQRNLASGPLASPLLTPSRRAKVEPNEGPALSEIASMSIGRQSHQRTPSELMVVRMMMLENMPSRADFEDEMTQLEMGHTIQRRFLVRNNELELMLGLLLLDAGKPTSGAYNRLKGMLASEALATLKTWTLRNFTLVTTVQSDGQPEYTVFAAKSKLRVATREEIYDLVVAAHLQVNHKGRDKTYAVIRDKYAMIPKEVIARFVAICPYCVNTRGPASNCSTPHKTPATTGHKRTLSSVSDVSDHSPCRAMSRRALPTQNLSPLSSPFRMSVGSGTSRSAMLDFARAGLTAYVALLAQQNVGYDEITELLEMLFLEALDLANQNK